MFPRKKNLKAGCIVTLKDKNLPPRIWALGRILKVISGWDRKVIVLEIKTVSGIVTQLISNVYFHPIKENE